MARISGDPLQVMRAALDELDHAAVEASIRLQFLRERIAAARDAGAQAERQHAARVDTVVEAIAAARSSAAREMEAVKEGMAREAESLQREHLQATGELQRRLELQVRFGGGQWSARDPFDDQANALLDLIAYSVSHLPQSLRSNAEPSTKLLGACRRRLESMKQLRAARQKEEAERVRCLEARAENLGLSGRDGKAGAEEEEEDTESAEEVEREEEEEMRRIVEERLRLVARSRRQRAAANRGMQRLKNLRAVEERLREELLPVEEQLRRGGNRRVRLEAEVAAAEVALNEMREMNGKIRRELEQRQQQDVGCT